MRPLGECPDAVDDEVVESSGPYRVALCLAGEPLALLPGQLQRAGHRVQAFAAQRLVQLQAVEPLADVALVDREAIDAGGAAQASSALGALAALSQAMPVVLITGRALAWPALAREGVLAVALLPRPVDGATLLACLPMWVQRHREAAALRAREAELLAALKASRHISSAVGMLAERHHLSIDAAFERLRQQARARRQRTEEVALGILAGASTVV